MKKVITLALALVMVLAIAVPCFAGLTEADGVYTAEGDSQAAYKDDASSHYTIEADFSDLKNADHGGNGCCGFIIGKNNSEGQCLAIYLTGGGSFGWTGYGKWWTHNPESYTVQGDTWETRFAHIKVEYFNDNGNVTVTATCNDKTIVIDAETFETKLKAKGLETVEPLTDASHITIVEKINGGQIKNVVYTDLTAPVTPPASLAEVDGVWTAANGQAQAVWMDGITSKHYKVAGDFYDQSSAGDNGFCGFVIGADGTENNGICIGVSGEANGPGIGWTSWCKWWGVSSWDGANEYTPTEDRFAHIIVEVDATAADDVIFKITCNDKTLDDVSLKALIASGGKYEGLEVFGVSNITLYEKIAGGQVKNLTFTDLEEPETTDPGTGTEPKPTGAAAIVVSMVALVSLAAVTVVAKKRH